MPSVIFLGSKPGSVIALRNLIKRSWNVIAVVVCDDHSHDWLPGPSLRDFAQQQGLKVYSHQHELREIDKVDFVISYMYRYLVKPPALRLAQRAALNFHAAPLPRYGGWAFYNIAILEGATEYGCTCHYMDEGFDTGPILKVDSFSVDTKKETAVTLEAKAQLCMLNLLSDFCYLAEDHKPLPSIKQEPEKMRYMTRNEFEKLKRIPDDADAEMADRIARAFWYPPYQCAYVINNGVKLEVIPEIAKQSIATNTHKDQLTFFRGVND